jgi:hypothetical protein
MTRAAAVFLLLVIACSRVPIDSDGTRPAAASGGIPAAASSARLDTPASAPPSATSSALGETIGNPFAGPATSGSPRGLVHDDGVTLSKESLPPEVIRRIVRQNFGRFRLCYQNGLRTNPTLAGLVRIRFVIDADGSVGTVSDAGSVLADKAVLLCVQRGFASLSFPEPEKGALSATYSLSLSPS